MAHVKDLWTKPNPNPDSHKRRIQNTRWGKGKRWQVRWEEHGKQVSKTFDTREAADEFRARIEVGQADGTWITKDKAELTLNDIWSPWLSLRAHASTKTQRDYISVWEVHIQPTWGDIRLGDIHPHVVTVWLADLRTLKGVPNGGEPRPLGVSARRKVGMIMKSMLDLAVKLGAILHNPLDASDVPKQGKSERRYLSVTEVDSLIEACPTYQSQLLLRVLLMTGLRPGEAKALQVKDLDVTRGRLAIRRDVDDLGRIDATKTRSHRDVPIGGELLHELSKIADDAKDDDWLLSDEYGNVWTTARWRVVWHNLQEWTNIRGIHTYELRHTAASLAIAAGADVKTVQRMLGHTSAR